VLRLGRLIFSNEQVIRTDNTLVGGDSGGPLLDLEGKVVGIHSRIGRPVTANLHVPIDVFVAHADRFRNGDNWGLPLGDAGGPFLGIAGEDHPQGVRITQVIEGQAAAQAGLRVGDVVTHFDAKPVKNYRDLVLTIQTRKPSDKVKLRIERGEERLELEAEVGKRPEP
jgi:serine protease Do